MRLNPAEVCEVIAAVCSEMSSANTNVMTISSGLNNNSGKPSMDVAVSVLIKLIIDMYVSLHFTAIYSTAHFSVVYSKTLSLVYMDMCVHTLVFVCERQ